MEQDMEKDLVINNLRQTIKNLNSTEFDYVLDWDKEDEVVSISKYHGRRKIMTLRQSVRYNSIEGFKLDCLRLLKDIGICV